MLDDDAERPYHLREEVSLPVESVGECRFANQCKQFRADLADGLCVEHWDKTISSYRPGRYNIV
jgi:hypothetical protein